MTFARRCTRSRLGSLASLGVGGLLGCSSTTSVGASDASLPDAADASHPDVSTDAPLDGAPDSKADAAPAPDAVTDSAADAFELVDAGFDAATCVGSDAGVAPPSCAPGGPGLSNCGPCRETCCASPEVTGGTYDRTYDLTDAGVPAPPLDGGPTGEADPASLSGFRLDKYLVTVGRFRQFVTAWGGGTGYLPPAGAGKHVHLNLGQGLASAGSAGDYEPGWVTSDDANVAPTDGNLACYPNYATWTSAPGSQENLPINCVTWAEAYAFCIWDGGFLPSESEWEYAAAGGSEEREYPWGATSPGAESVYAIYDCEYPDGTGTCSGVVNAAPVGAATHGVGRWGQMDLAGEVFQWNLDGYAQYTASCVDCAYTSAASNRVIRGGYFAYDATFLLPSNRGNYPEGRVNGVGFRCARGP